MLLEKPLILNLYSKHSTFALGYLRSMLYRIAHAAMMSGTKVPPNWICREVICFRIANAFSTLRPLQCFRLYKDLAIESLPCSCCGAMSQDMQWYLASISKKEETKSIKRNLCIPQYICVCFLVKSGLSENARVICWSWHINEQIQEPFSTVHNHLIVYCESPQLEVV